MTNIQTIQNVVDCAPLYLPHSLYLKPLARMHISVALPTNKTGKSISNLDIMDRLSAALKPDKFLVLKVSKSTVEFIRFEAELDERAHLRSAIGRLDGITLRIGGFSESFRVRCSESKDEFPTRHDWDSFFRDTSQMDEMKAGERPDTIHITHLPIRWFCPRHAEHDDNSKPSESIFRRIFEKFGTVRCVDIPICDPYRNKMNSDINGMKTFSFEQDVLFEAYVQFDEYVGFVRAMDEFRGMKLVRKFVDKTQAVNIAVQFDKTKHLSEAQLQRRERVRKRLIGKAKAEEEEIERQKKLEKDNVERERQKEAQLKLVELEKQREREEKRKEKHLKKIQERGQVEISQKIRVEERKLMIAQRKLESIRLLEQLFGRIKLKHASSSSRKHNRRPNDHEEDALKSDLRDRLVQKYKSATEKLLNEQRKKVEEIKSETPLLGLLKSKKSKNSDSSDNDEKSAAQKRKHNDDEPTSGAAATAGKTTGGDNEAASSSSSTAALPMNPFKAMAALATAGGAGAYSTEQQAAAASEWMKSLSMFPYHMPPVFPGMSALYRPSVPFPVSANYRGFAPRMRRPGGGGPRVRSRGGRGSYYNNYNRYNYDEENYDEGDGGGGGGYYRRTSYSRSRSRSRRRSHSHSRRSRSRSRSRRRSSRSRSRSRSHSTRRSRTHRRSRSRRRSTKSRTRSKSPAAQRSSTNNNNNNRNKMLASTRRSRSASDWSRSRSRSRSRTQPTRSKRSWSRRGRGHSRSRSRSRSHSTRSARRPAVVIETDKLVRTAEEIKRTIEKEMQERMREDEREIKDNFDFRRRKHTMRTDVDLEASAAATEAAMDKEVANKAAAATRADKSPPHAVRKDAADAELSERAHERDRSDRSDGAISRHNSSDRDAIDALLTSSSLA